MTAMVEMTAEDANNLDEVVRELGIGESFVTPAEAVRQLKVQIEILTAERNAFKQFRDRFNEVFDDSYRLAESIVRHHTDSPAIFGLQPDHRFRENASPLDVAADLGQAIAAAKAGMTIASLKSK